LVLGEGKEGAHVEVTSFVTEECRSEFEKKRGRKP